VLAQTSSRSQSKKSYMYQFISLIYARISPITPSMHNLKVKALHFNLSQQT